MRHHLSSSRSQVIKLDGPHIPLCQTMRSSQTKADCHTGQLHNPFVSRTTIGMLKHARLDSWTSGSLCNILACSLANLALWCDHLTKSASPVESAQRTLFHWLYRGAVCTWPYLASARAGTQSLALQVAVAFLACLVLQAPVASVRAVIDSPILGRGPQLVVQLGRTPASRPHFTTRVYRQRKVSSANRNLE